MKNKCLICGHKINRNRNKCIYCETDENIFTVFKNLYPDRTEDFHKWCRNKELYERQIKRKTDRKEYFKYLIITRVPVNILDQIIHLHNIGKSCYQISVIIKKNNLYRISRDKIRNIIKFIQ